MCLAQGHNAVTPVSLKPTAPRSRVKHSTCTTEPLRFLYYPIKMYISVHSDCFILANSADPGEMPYNLAVNLGRHCLPNFTPFGVSCIQRILLQVKFISLYTALEHRLDEFHDTLVHIAY